VSIFSADDASHKVKTDGQAGDEEHRKSSSEPSIFDPKNDSVQTDDQEAIPMKMEAIMYPSITNCSLALG